MSTRYIKSITTCLCGLVVLATFSATIDASVEENLGLRFGAGLCFCVGAVALLIKGGSDAGGTERMETLLGLWTLF